MALANPAAIKIDSTWLTDQGRQPVEAAREGRFIEIELASGRIKKYWQGNTKRTFSITWEWLPSTDVNNIDGYAGRDTMRGLLKDSQTTHTLTFNDKDGGNETYTVWVEEYTEALKRRSSEEFFWDVTVSFKEQ